MLIDFQVDWTTPAGADDPTAVAWGHGKLLVCDEVVWGGEADGPGVEWTWSDLLEHLAEIWPWLMWEQAYPLGLNPRDPTKLRQSAEARWDDDSLERVEDEDDELHAWEDRHYLNAGLGGLYASGVCVFREGHQALLCANGDVHRVSLLKLLGDLAVIGNKIADQLRTSTSIVAVERVSRWEQRENGDSGLRLRIETGLSDASLFGSAPSGLLDEEPLRAAARMTRSLELDEDQMASLLQQVGALPRGHLSPEFLVLSRDAEDFLDEPGDSPREQGLELARWIRRRHGWKGTLDPKSRLKRWGVLVHDEALASDCIDAVATWAGEQAMVLLNSAGKAKRPTRRNATLAHEICHLLVDRHGALPVADVMGGHSPRHAEIRANAFLAEFLVPRSEIERYCDQGEVTEAKVALKKLSGRYKASWQVVAHQLLNSGAAKQWAERERGILRRYAKPYSHI